MSNVMDLSKLKELKELEKDGKMSVVLPRTDAGGAGKLPNRVLTIEQVYLQGADSEPVLFELRESTSLQSDEQPFDRVLTVGEEWQPLAKGTWIPEPGLILVTNTTYKKARQTNPTEEERKALAGAVIEIRMSGQDSVPFAAIPPGKGVRILPAATVDQYVVRCKVGSARYRVVLLPR